MRLWVGLSLIFILSVASGLSVMAVISPKAPAPVASLDVDPTHLFNLLLC